MLVMPMYIKAVMIPFIFGAGIGITVGTKEPDPDPIPRWNRLQEWNRLQGWNRQGCDRSKNYGSAIR